MNHPKRLILIGFIFVLFGAVAPWLMVLKVVKSTFFFNFLTYGFSITGLILGIIGAAMLAGPRKEDR